jgi:hypothetical protein
MMSAPELKKGLLAQGFREDRQEKLLRRKLFDDFVVVVATESGRWGKDETDAHLLLRSPRFSQLLDAAFDSARFPFAEYEARKAEGDPSGELAGTLAGIELHKGKPSLFSAAIHLSTEKLGSLLDAMDSSESLCRTLYGSELASFLWLTEGSWVYLYLAAAQELTPGETLARIKSDAGVLKESRRWHLKKAIDLQVIEAFFQVYAETVRSRKKTR